MKNLKSPVLYAAKHMGVPQTQWWGVLGRNELREAIHMSDITNVYMSGLYDEYVDAKQ